MDTHERGGETTDGGLPTADGGGTHGGGGTGETTAARRDDGGGLRRRQAGEGPEAADGADDVRLGPRGAGKDATAGTAADDGLRDAGLDIGVGRRGEGGDPRGRDEHGGVPQGVPRHRAMDGATDGMRGGRGVPQRGTAVQRGARRGAVRELRGADDGVARTGDGRGPAGGGTTPATGGGRHGRHAAGRRERDAAGDAGLLPGAERLREGTPPRAAAEAGKDGAV
nr:hypothetical protein [uncultured Bacteroides sp.]